MIRYSMCSVLLSLSQIIRVNLYMSHKRDVVKMNYLLIFVSVCLSVCLSVCVSVP